MLAAPPETWVLPERLDQRLNLSVSRGDRSAAQVLGPSTIWSYGCARCVYGRAGLISPNRWSGLRTDAAHNHSLSGGELADARSTG